MFVIMTTILSFHNFLVLDALHVLDVLPIVLRMTEVTCTKYSLYDFVFWTCIKYNFYYSDVLYCSFVDYILIEGYVVMSMSFSITAPIIVSLGNLIAH